MKKVTQIIVNILLFLVFIEISTSTPKYSISTTILAPRAGMLDQEESTYWKSVVNYHQKIGSNIQINSQIEYGSNTDRLQNPFRIYNFSIKLINLGQHQIKFGRIAKWNSFVLGRVDGVDYSFKSNRLGVFQLYGGFKAVTDFIDTAFADKKFFLAGWNNGNRTKNTSLAYWFENDGSNTQSFTGVSFKGKWLSQYHVYGNLVFSLDAGQVYRSRIQITRKINRNILMLGVRQKRYLNAEPYPWVKEIIHTKPILTFGLKSRIRTNLIWSNNLIKRLDSKSNYYFKSMIYKRVVSFALIAGIQERKSILGGQLGFVKKLNTNMKIGGSFSYHAVEYDGLINTNSSVGVYSWVGWQPSDMISIRVFGRYFQNPFYRIDTRMGLVFNVAI